MASPLVKNAPLLLDIDGGQKSGPSIAAKKGPHPEEIESA
jgi:hypothetical protein